MTILRLLLRSLRLCGQPLVSLVEPPRPKPLQLGLDLVALERHLVGLLRLGPEVGHREPVVEIRAKVVHDPDGEHYVDAELPTQLLAGEGSQVPVPFRVVVGASYLEHFQIQPAHDESCPVARRLNLSIVGLPGLPPRRVWGAIDALTSPAVETGAVQIRLVWCGDVGALTRAARLFEYPAVHACFRTYDPCHTTAGHMCRRHCSVTFL